MKRWLQILAALGALAFAPTAAPHAASTAYLDLDVVAGHGNVVALQWAVALRDLDAVLDLDANGDGQLTWSEVTARQADIEALARAVVRVARPDGSACPLAPDAPRWAQLESGSYLVLPARAACAAPVDRVRVDYRFLAQIDATHRALLTGPGAASPQPLAPGQQADVALAASPANDAGAGSARFGALLADGIAHILGGPDHLLFLVALLLPAVVTRKDGRWTPRAGLKPAVIEVAWIATAFTVAHSITLGLASFHVVAVPARVIEPLIAATVLTAALNNLRPIVTQRLAAVAFSFGLVHGFGFAEVLAPLALPARDLALALLGFNLGVELGQLAIVACVFALLALARRWRGYPRWVLGAGSAVLALTAATWLVERVFDVPLFALAAAAG
jgi:hypothetical protein